MVSNADGVFLDGSSGGTLACAGLTQKQRGEVLHPGPQVSVEEADVTGENVVPEVEAQRMHGGADTGQTAFDEVEGASYLVEDGEILVGFFFGKAEPVEHG